MKAKGKVYFVGAGPGNPELLTLAAVRLIRDADVILYDELIPLFCLNLNQKNLSEKIYVGKKSGNHFLTQDHINQIIIDKYRQLSETSQQDFFLIRLKGGDPTIFGRIQEEMEVLKKAKIHYEIIPGVSSFYSAPAYSGIPVTSREISQGFSVLTGHFKNNWEEKEIAYSFNKTIIYLMAMKNFKKIINKHLMTGKKPETPVAIISKATTHEQECYVSTLKDLNESRQVFSHPGILVIGEIVREIEKFKWYEWTSFYKLSFYYLDNDLPVALAFYLLANGAAIHSLQFQNKIADNGILIISQKKIKDNRLVLSKNKKMIIIDDGQNESSMIKNKQMILKSNCWKERFILSSLQIQALNEFIKD